MTGLGSRLPPFTTRYHLLPARCAAICAIVRSARCADATSTRTRCQERGPSVHPGAFAVLSLTTWRRRAWNLIRATPTAPSAGPSELGGGPYGDRGIKVCGGRSKSFLAFRDRAMSSGHDPSAGPGERTKDRIDPAGDNRPDIWRWISNEEQQQNKRASQFQEVVEWASQIRATRTGRGAEPFAPGGNPSALPARYVASPFDRLLAPRRPPHELRGG